MVHLSLRSVLPRLSLALLENSGLKLLTNSEHITYVDLPSESAATTIDLSQRDKLMRNGVYTK